MYKTEEEKKNGRKGADKHYTEKKVQNIFGIMMSCLEIIREVLRGCEICKCVLNFVNT